MVRVVERQDRGKNCPEAMPRQTDVSLGLLRRVAGIRRGAPPPWLNNKFTMRSIFRTAGPFGNGEPLISPLPPNLLACHKEIAPLFAALVALCTDPTSGLRPEMGKKERPKNGFWPHREKGENGRKTGKLAQKCVKKWQYLWKPKSPETIKIGAK